MNLRSIHWVAVFAMFGVTLSRAAFVVEVDADGASDEEFEAHPNFAFAGDTTRADISARAYAVGLDGGNSVFGGNGQNEPDRYEYAYTPGNDADNLELSRGQRLNGSRDRASGREGGASGTYEVYATWPKTSNVTGGPTRYVLAAGDEELFSVELDQNDRGDEWVRLGVANLEAGKTYTLSQEPTGENTYVSMRAAAVMFQAVSLAPQER